MSLARRLKRLLRRRATGVFAYEQLNLIADRYPQYEVGRGSYGDLEVVWQNTDSVLRMGSFCSVASGVQVFLAGEHRPDWASTYPFTAISREITKWPGYPHTKGDVTIGNDVWLCDGAIILSGVTIGDGAVIGARAVVARNVAPYAIVAGNPAVHVRSRFSEDVVARLLALKWWDWPDERIAKALSQMMSSDIEGFLDTVDRGKL